MGALDERISQPRRSPNSSSWRTGTKCSRASRRWESERTTSVDPLRDLLARIALPGSKVAQALGCHLLGQDLEGHLGPMAMKKGESSGREHAARIAGVDRVVENGFFILRATIWPPWHFVIRMKATIISHASDMDQGPNAVAGNKGAPECEVSHG